MVPGTEKNEEIRHGLQKGFGSPYRKKHIAINIYVNIQC
jgi:hypothetical protein